MIRQIHETTNYKQFKLMIANRALSHNNLQSLKRSIEEANHLDVEPILVNEKMEVIDGQHRLEIAEKLKKPIYYIQKEGLTMDDVVRLNSHGQKWTFNDYLSSFIRQNKPAYIKLNHYIEELEAAGFPRSSTLKLVAARIAGSKLNFKNGTLMLVPDDEARELIKEVKDILHFTVEGVNHHRSFGDALLSMLRSEEYDHDRFMERLKLSQRFIEYRGTRRDYARQFEDIYNFRMKTSTRLY